MPLDCSARYVVYLDNKPWVLLCTNLFLSHPLEGLLLSKDVGGEYKDNHAAIGQACEDAVDTPLSVAIKKTDKPVKYW